MTEKQAYQELILSQLDQKDLIPDTKELRIDNKSLNQLELLGVLNALTSRNVLQYEPITVEKWVATAEGESILEKGSPEARVFNAIPIGCEGISAKALAESLGDVAKFGQGAAFKAKWITKTKTGNFVRSASSIVDQTKIDLSTIRSTGSLGNATTLQALKKRQLIKNM